MRFLKSPPSGAPEAFAARVGYAIAAAFVAVALTLGATSSASRAQDASPEQVISATADEVLAVLTDDDLDSAAKRDRIEAVLVARADFDTIAKLVLARNWSKFSDSQKERFVPALKRYLSVTYGRNIDSFDNETVAVTGSRDEARGDKTVHSNIGRNSAEDIRVDYRLRRKDGQWRIIDIIAEGISMVSNLRSQFREILSRGGPDELLDVLAKKNAET